MSRLVPHLWFDKEAREASAFYVGLFDDSKISRSIVIRDTPSGDSESIEFILAGQEFMAISAGPFFKFNPSVSLMVNCGTKDEVASKWEKLSEGGEVLMPLGKYPFSDYYGWVQDRFGLSWQLMLVKDRENESVQKITPNLLFSNAACGKAEEAVSFYTGIFENSRINFVSRYQEGEAQSASAKVNFASFSLGKMNFSAMDNGYDVDYAFNEAFSLIVKCKNQQEIDFFWDKLSFVPEAEQCGWLKDKYGLSWQIVPERLGEMMNDPTIEKCTRVTKAFLKMKKLIIEDLEIAYSRT